MNVQRIFRITTCFLDTIQMERIVFIRVERFRILQTFSSRFQCPDTTNQFCPTITVTHWIISQSFFRPEYGLISTGTGKVMITASIPVSILVIPPIGIINFLQFRLCYQISIRIQRVLTIEQCPILFNSRQVPSHFFFINRTVTVQVSVTTHTCLGNSCIERLDSIHFFYISTTIPTSALICIESTCPCHPVVLIGYIAII